MDANKLFLLLVEVNQKAEFKLFVLQKERSKTNLVQTITFTSFAVALLI